MSKKSPEEILAGIDSSAVDDEVERILAMSPEERDRMLREEGADVGALDAKADAFHARGATEPERRRGGRDGFVFAAGIAFATAAGWLLIVGTGHEIARTDDVHPMPTVTPTTSARPPTLADLDRVQAYAELDAGHYEACLHYLDEAKTLDPNGDDERRVIDARNEARAALERDR